MLEQSARRRVGSAAGLGWNFGGTFGCVFWLLHGGKRAFALAVPGRKRLEREFGRPIHEIIS